MIKQINSLSSPYVYVYVNQENQLVVESKQEGGETQTSTHTTTSLPVWLKLERKDNEINAYYSNEQTEVVSDVNWTLLTTITLALANPFNIGLACGNNTDVAQAQFDKVEIQENSSDSLKQIPGDDKAPAWNALSYNSEYYPGVGESLQRDYELLQGYYVPKNIIELVVEFDTTIGEVNTILAELDADILLSMPGRSDLPEIGGLLLLLRVNSSTSFEMLEQIVKHLENNPNVHSARPIHIETRGNSLPSPTEELIWSRYSNSSDISTWGMQLSRIPQSWNLNAIGAISNTEIGVVAAEQNFENHIDLNFTDNFNGPRIDNLDKIRHGPHVLGIIGATFKNQIGVVGANPFANLGIAHIVVLDHPRAFIKLNEVKSNLRVVNYSQGSNPLKHAMSDQEAEKQGLIWSMI